MKWRHAVLGLAGTAAVIRCTRYDLLPRPGENAVCRILQQAGQGEDDLENGLDSPGQWTP